MRAVNLIPAEQQRGAGGTAGRSGGGAYFLIGGLALVVAMAGLFVHTNKSVSDKKAEVARVSQEATAAEAKAAALQSYTKFASVRAKRVDTVSQLAASRFDWAHSLREVARVLPTNAWLTSLTGTTSPTVSVGGGAGGGGGGLRAAMEVPAIEIAGCTTSQASVAKMMARLRLIDGVQRVSLEDSTKNASAAGAGGGGGGGGGGAASGAATGGDCRGASSHFPLFNIVVFYDAPSATVPVTGGTTQTASAITSSSSTTPASSASSTTPSTTTPAASGGVTP
ncbi:MAG TPA: PilN domain-containing protein [Baekduia sp.]|jgi:Tfp pilus assembly protein PilN